MDASNVFTVILQFILYPFVNHPENLGFFCTLAAWSFFVRYLRLVVNAISFWTFKAIPIPANPTVFPSDVSVIVPTTLSDPPQLMACINSILASTPGQVFLVVGYAKFTEAKELCKNNGLDMIKILTVPKLGKRYQLVEGLKSVETPVVVFADDDVVWPENYLAHLIAPLEVAGIGACGTNQRVIRNGGLDVFNFLGIAYLERRNFNTGATCYIDGGISTLSGRTSCYRTHILQTEEFYNIFQNSTWRGKILNSDDDKFLTKWVYSHKWRIHLQFTEDAVLSTSLDSGFKFFHQCLRWARAHWRGNIDVVCTQSYWYKQHIWTCYATYIGSLMTPSLVVDLYLFWSLHKALNEYGVGNRTYKLGIALFLAWLLFTKIIKLLGHFRRYPQDMIFIPVSIIFAYFHGFLNVYSLLTLHVTAWGNKHIKDDPTPTTSPGPNILLQKVIESDEVPPALKLE